MKKIGLISLVSLSLMLVGFFIFNNDSTSVEAQEESTTEAKLTQDEIKNKMVNSIDYFEYASGEFTYTSEAAGFDYSVSYNVVNVPGEYKSKVTYYDNASQCGFDTVFDGQTLYDVDHKAEYYIESDIMAANAPYAPEEWSDEDKAYENRIEPAPNGENVYYYREDPTYMSIAKASLFPQEVAFGYLQDNNMWAITGYEEYLGREVAVLEGDLNEYYQDKTQGSTFKMWVDTETGILLQKEVYNESGEVVEKLETTSFTLNDPSTATYDYSYTVPSGYTKQDAPHHPTN